MSKLIKLNAATIFVLVMLSTLFVSKSTQLPHPQTGSNDQRNDGDDTIIFPGHDEDDDLKMIAIAPTIVSSRIKSPCVPPERMTASGKCKLPFGVQRTIMTTTKRPKIEEEYDIFFSD